MQSSFFSNARGFHISGGNFSHVQGDQYNHTTLPVPSSSSSDPSFALIDESATSTIMAVYNVNGNQINQVIQHEKKEPTEFDDYRIVKRGDICILRDVCDDSPSYQCDMCRQSEVTRTVYIAKVNGARGKFTVMSYRGPGGQKAFEQDFRKFSSVVTSKVPQMYAVDIGSIPSILYWNELVPAVVLTRNLGWMCRVYLRSLCWIWNCKVEELWMDSARGVICCGPEGPDPDLSYLGLVIEDMPSTVDLLQEDACLRFMASYKSKMADRAFVEGIGSAGSDVVVPESFDQPTVISALTQTPITVANNVWEHSMCTFVERKVLESGLTRFRVVGDERLFLWLNKNADSAWLCQAVGVFHARGIGLDDDLGVYRLARHVAEVEGDLSRNQIHRQRRSQQPIYLFLHPHPPNQLNSNASSLHFWSSHEDGQKPFPPDICNDLGLPTTLEYKDWGYRSFSWSTKYYRQLDEYQRLRGFDPTTTDFAQHLGFNANIFHPVNDTNRFDEVYNEPLELHSNLDHPDLSATDYPAIQQRAIIKGLDTVLFDSKDEPISTHAANERRMLGGEEGKIERRAHAEQNLRHKNHGACNEQSVPDRSLRTIHPLPRRTLSSEELYPLQYNSARLVNCASNVDSSSLQHYAYVSPHQNFPLSGLPASLPSTSTSFIPLPANTITTSSAAIRTGIPPRAYPEIPQYGMATLSSRDESFQLAPERCTYRAGTDATNNAFPSSASTIPSSVFAQPGNDSTHASQTTRWPGASPLGTSTNNHHWTSPSVLPNDLSIPPHTSPVGYPTHPGVHVHGPSPTVPQRHSSFVPFHRNEALLPDEHWSAYHPTSSDASRDRASMFDNYNTSYQTDTGVIDTVRDIGARSEDE
ncbi:hypothetical protein PQX77_017636 [Marasmius sp. AFHP31]|nr:hypothetical protein PQX77_017636 [Marasmius sp. AFHP31]